MDTNLEKATDEVIRELTAEKLKLTSENEELRAMLKKKEEEKAGGTRNQFVRIIEKHKVRR